MYVCLQYFMKRVFYVFLQVSLWVSKALGGFKALSLTYILEYCIFTFVRFFYLLSYPRNFESVVQKLCEVEDAALQEVRERRAI